MKGETLYINIQKRGRTDGPARTPQKMRQRENIKFAMLPPVSAESTPAIIIFVKVEVKSRNVQTSRNINIPLSETWSYGIAFL